MEHRILPLVKAIRILARALPAPRTYACPLARAAGAYAARDVRAPNPVPAHPVSRVDGFLVRAGAAGGAYRVAGECSPLACPTELPADGLTLRIEKGTRVPPGAAVVPVASAALVGSATVRLSAPCETAIAQPGALLASGALIVGKGERVGAGAVALLAAAGLDRIEAVDPPAVHVICIGSEFVDSESPEIDTRYLHDSLGARGIPVSLVAVVPDEEARIRDCVVNALAGGCVVGCGGTGAGLTDRAVASFRPGGIRFVAEGVALSPGESTAIALSQNGACLFMPGDPEDVVAVTQLLLVPALARCSGMKIGSWQEAAPAPLARPWSGEPDKHLLVPAMYDSGTLEVRDAAGAGGLLRAGMHALLPPGERERMHGIPLPA